MIKFDGRIVQFGFGAVGKSFYEKVNRKIKFNENNYYVITRDKYEFEAFINMGGIASNYIQEEVNKENFESVFSLFLSDGDLLIDFADTVGTKDICNWCALNNVMYLNTGEADWPDNWYSILNENKKKNLMREKFNKNPDINKHPIVLQHGNNPGLVSHFMKAGIEYIIEKQFKKDKELKQLLKDGKFNELAYKLGIKMIHVNDIDLQDVSQNNNETLYSTWCIDSFFFEMLSEATFNVGTHEVIDYKNECKLLDEEAGFLEFKDLAVNKECITYYPNGKFNGFLVPHEETITISSSLEVKENDNVLYKPSVMFIYSPCEKARKYFDISKVNEYPDVDPSKPLDYEDENGAIIRGYKYPNNAEIVYKENILSGTEYVGVLILGDKFEPVWIGNRIELSYLYKDKKCSYWQTPTITPVAMSALAAVCWMIKNKDKKGVFFPDDIKDYKYILNIAEKYISKTIYITFDKETLSNEIGVDFNDLQSKDIFVK